jgi:hypothetical protein
MVLGSDNGLEETYSLALCALVGRLYYTSSCTNSLPVWVESTWMPLLRYTPEVFFLLKGWFGFRFKSPEDPHLVLEKIWVIDGSNLIIKHW